MWAQMKSKEEIKEWEQKRKWTKPEFPQTFNGQEKPIKKQNKTKQKTDRYNGQSGRKKTSIGREHVKDDFMWRSWGPHLSFAGSDARSNRIGICCHLWFPWIWMPEAPCCTPRQILITLVLTFESKPSCLKESWLHPTYFSHSNPAEEDRRIWICW